MKRPTNLSVDAELLDEAKSLNINLSQTLEGALRKLIAHKRSEQWKRDNKEAFASYEDHILKRGSFGDKHKVF